MTHYHLTTLNGECVIGAYVTRSGAEKAAAKPNGYTGTAINRPVIACEGETCKPKSNRKTAAA